MANKAYIIRAFVQNKQVNYTTQVISEASNVNGEGATSIFIENDEASSNTLYWGGIPIKAGYSRKFINEPGIIINQDFELIFR